MHRSARKVMCILRHCSRIDPLLAATRASVGLLQWHWQGGDVGTCGACVELGRHLQLQPHAPGKQRGPTPPNWAAGWHPHPLASVRPVQDNVSAAESNVARETRRGSGSAVGSHSRCWTKPAGESRVSSSTGAARGKEGGQGMPSQTKQVACNKEDAYSD